MERRQKIDEKVKFFGKYVLPVTTFFTGTHSKSDFTGNAVITGTNLEHYSQSTSLSDL